MLCFRTAVVVHRPIPYHTIPYRPPALPRVSPGSHALRPAGRGRVLWQTVFVRCSHRADAQGSGSGDAEARARRIAQPARHGRGRPRRVHRQQL
jgi:hypothetical protein